MERLWAWSPRHSWHAHSAQLHSCSVTHVCCRVSYSELQVSLATAQRSRVIKEWGFPVTQEGPTRIPVGLLRWTCTHFSGRSLCCSAGQGWQYPPLPHQGNTRHSRPLNHRHAVLQGPRTGSMTLDLFMPSSLFCKMEDQPTSSHPCLPTSPLEVLVSSPPSPPSIPDLSVQLTCWALPWILPLTPQDHQLPDFTIPQVPSLPPQLPFLAPLPHSPCNPPSASACPAARPPLPDTCQERVLEEFLASSSSS